MSKFTKDQAEAKVYELTAQLKKLKQDKKDVNAGYREKIKDIESEIDAILDEQKDLENP